jgi:LPPG:FO 2-phospho-L-lactate transferase
MITVLCGGVGAAKLLEGMCAAFPPEEVTAVVNTGDDDVMHGLYVCPDLDTITYTLSDEVDRGQGWGLSDDTTNVMAALERFGGPAWFKLGDRDLATHMYRTGRLRDGVPLSTVTAEVALSFGLGIRLLPMSDQEVRTRIRLADGAGVSGELAFQDYFVRLRHAVPVAEVRFAGAAEALPAPGVLDSIAAADVIVIAPSNPVISIDPILAVPGIAAALRARRDRVVAISPIVAGAALKGPADRLLAELGGDASVVGVAKWHVAHAGTLVIDQLDNALRDAVVSVGLSCAVTGTVMTSVQVAADLARFAVAAGRLAGRV